MQNPLGSRLLTHLLVLSQALLRLGELVARVVLGQEILFVARHDDKVKLR